MSAAITLPLGALLLLAAWKTARWITFGSTCWRLAAPEAVFYGRWYWAFTGERVTQAYCHDVGGVLYALLAII